MSRWIIKDWAGNKPFGEMCFETFEDAWSHVYQWIEANVPESEFDEACGEYHVEVAS